MKFISILFLIIIPIQSAFGQTENNFKYSVGFGFGIGGVKFTDQNSGLSLNTDAKLKHCSSIFEVSFYKWFGFFTPPSEYIVSYCLKYGREFKFVREGGLFSLTNNLDSFANYSVQLKTGISFLESRERISVKYQRLISDEYNTKSKTGFGLPLEIELRTEISKFFGLNTKVSGNLNAISPFYDISLGVYFGEL